MRIWPHSFLAGKFCLKNKCVKISIIIPATANLTCAITNGWEESNAILVAVEAEAHRNAKTIPAIIHLYSCLMVKIWF
jgi:hypothetical protein